MKTNKPKLGLSLLLAAVFFTFLSSCRENNENPVLASTDIVATVEMEAILTSPPNVPPPTGKRNAKRLIVDMEILEQEGEMTNGVKYVYWTFGGTVPGSFIRTKIGDEVEFHLKNHPDNRSRWWSGIFFCCSRTRKSVFFQDFKPRTLCLPLRHSPCGDAHCQWHVWSYFSRTRRRTSRCR